MRNQIILLRGNISNAVGYIYGATRGFSLVLIFRVESCHQFSAPNWSGYTKYSTLF